MPQRMNTKFRVVQLFVHDLRRMLHAARDDKRGVIPHGDRMDSITLTRRMQLPPIMT